MSRLTLLDVAKNTGNDKIVGLIEENLAFAPEVRLFPSRTIKGTQYRTSVRTAFPNVGFRQANDGHTPGKSSFDKRLVECFIFGGVIQVDKAVALAHEDGPQAFEMIEASGVVGNSMIKLGSQIWYGTTADANGFAGIKSLTAFGGAQVLNSGGSDANVQSSLYAVKFGIKDVMLVVGQNGSMNLAEFRDQQIDGETAGTIIPGRVSDMTAWIGLQVANTKCVGRICNIGADTETGDTLTDSKIAQLLQKFPTGYKPDMLFASRRSIGQLQRSRSVTINAGPGGAKPDGSVEATAPWPTSAFNIPLHETDSILDTDAVET